MRRVRLTALFLVLTALLLPVLPVRGLAEEHETVVVASGVYEGISWKIESRWNAELLGGGGYERILVLSGNGPIPDFDHPSSDCVGDVLPPWFRCRKTIYLADGVTPDPNQNEWWYNTGCGWGTMIRGIEIGSGITEIGDYAFSPAAEHSNYIERIEVPDTVIRIGKGAFLTQFDLRELVIPDSVTQFPEYDKIEPVFDHRTKIICSSRSAALRYAQEAGNETEISDLALSLTLGGKTGTVTMKKGQTLSYRAATNVSAFAPEVSLSIDGDWYGTLGALVLDTAAGTLKAVEGGATATLKATAGGKTASVQIQVKKSYNITYNLDGGKNNTKNPASYTEGSVVKLKSPSKKGYKFEGWYDSSYGGTKISRVENRDIIVYARWKKITVPQVKKLKVPDQKTKKMVISFGKVQYARGYQVQYSTKSSFKSGYTKSKTVKTNKLTISSGLKYATYHVRVRAYKLDSKNCKVYGPWSSAVKVKIRK